MRVVDLLKLFIGLKMTTVRIYASVIVFNDSHYVLVDMFKAVNRRVFDKENNDFLAEEITAFDFDENGLNIYIKGDRD